jgi:uncharacterized phage infection (PIP) family protein YhgE
MKTKTKNQDILQKGSQWLRVGILTLTTLGPIINTVLDRVRQRSDKSEQQAQVKQTKGKVQEAQVAARQRLEELTVVRRQQAAEQAQQLREQAQQLKKQAEQLRKALREEAKQRAKLAKQMREAGVDWSQDLLKRGERLTDDLVEQSARLSQDLKERGEHITGDIKERASTLTQELTKRSSQVTQDLTERSSQVTQELAKRSSQVTQDLTERGQELIQKRGRLLAIIGFSAGCAAAAALTFIIVRRLVQQNSEQEQQIELPPDNLANGATPQSQSQAEELELGQPAGEIVVLNADGTIVTIVEPENEGE